MRRRSPVWMMLAVFVPALSHAQPPPAVFGPYAEYSTGLAPHSIAIGDFNEDEVPDLAVANRHSNTISILLGTGGGFFGTATQVATAAGPYGVACGDLNGDGSLDVVAACFDGGGVSLLMGRGDGTFSPGPVLTTALRPIAVAIADFNSDGRADLATANHGGGSVSVLLGTGAGGFADHVEYPAGGATWAITVADVNNDAKWDLLAANEGASTVSVFLGTGDGTFGVEANYPSISSPRSVAAGDFDHDGVQDLSVGGVSVLPGLGNGIFGAKTDLATLPFAFGAVIQDMNLDGNLDIAIADASESSVSIFRGSGDGSFEPRTVFPGGSGCRAIAFGDLDGDGAADMVVANEGLSTIWVRLNESPRAIATATELAASPLGSVYSEPIVLTASVTPDPGGGEVQFFEGSTLLGAVSLANGLGMLTVSELPAGDHGIRATFQGFGVHASSTSPEVVVQIAPASTAVAISSSPNPSLQHSAVTLEATVFGLPPAGAVPSGRVQFQVDGINLGEPLLLVEGSVATTMETLSPGAHDISGIYVPDDPLRFEESTSPPAVQNVVASEPEIVAVRDVPNDQGGFVFVTWRCKLDQAGIRIVTSFRVWRRVPHLSSEYAKSLTERSLLRTVDGTGNETFWESVADLPAAQLVSYGYTARTTQDSIAESNPYTAYFVQALTADPFRSFSSSPDSGYSVDNLAPPTPLPFAVVYGPSANALHWASSRAPDLREFRLYRGIMPDFEPTSSALVIATTDTGYVDVPGAYYYKLAAIDVHGNRSLFAAVSPDAPTATLASLVSVSAFSDRIKLLWHVGSARGGTISVQRREADGDWLRVGVPVVEAGGYVRHEDAGVSPGTRYGYRLGIHDGGEERFAGETWVTAEDPAFALERIHPNPSRSGALSVQFVLARGGSAKLDVFDVVGRRVAEMDVGSLGAGRHVMKLGEDVKLSPGFYMIRLAQGESVAIGRVSVVK